MNYGRNFNFKNSLIPENLSTMECLFTIPTKKAAKKTKNMMSVQDLSSIGPSRSSSSSSGAVLLPEQHSMCCQFSVMLVELGLELLSTDTDTDGWNQSLAECYRLNNTTFLCCSNTTF